MHILFRFHKSLAPIFLRLGCLHLLIINIIRFQYILTGYEIKLLLHTYLHTRAVNPRLLYIIPVSNNIIVRRKFCCEFSWNFRPGKVAQRCVLYVYSPFKRNISLYSNNYRGGTIVFQFYLYYYFRKRLKFKKNGSPAFSFFSLIL